MANNVSPIQLKANRNNALKSTGPRNFEAVSQNALKTGIFSKHNVLSTEDPEEYQSLLNGVSEGLRPHGLLENALVEKIVATLWRQKRLIKAETATIELEQLPQKIASEVAIELNDRLISEHNLEQHPEDQLHSCKLILQECTQLPHSQCDLDTLQEDCPNIYSQICNDAKTANIQVSEFYKQINFKQYSTNLIQNCINQIKQFERNVIIQKVAGLVQQKHSIVKTEEREKLIRYNLMLDNQMYKAIKELNVGQSNVQSN